MFNMFKGESSYLDFPSVKGVRLAKQDGIATITYNGKGDVGCVKSPKAWTPATYKQFYFEVTVANPGEKGTIAIGLSQNDKDPAKQQPGWFKGSFGYHADDGIAFCYDTLSISAFGPAWNKTQAVVGCGVDFSAEMIFFVFPNGTRKTLPTHKLKEFPTKLYPMIGLHSAQESVVVNFGQKLPFKHDPFGSQHGRVPRTFKIPPKFHADVADNTITVSCTQNATLQADSFFPNLANVKPYFEVTILAMKPNILVEKEVMSIGYTDQLCDFNKLVGLMQNSFGWQNNGKAGWNMTADNVVEPFGQGDTIGCGLTYNSFNQRKVFLTRNGKFLGYINKTVATGMDCFPSLGFQGEDIRVRFNFGECEFKWDIQTWPKHEKICYMDALPNEALQMIVEYAAHTYAFTAINLSAVSKKFGEASKRNQIWRRLFYKSYPEQNSNLKIKDWRKFFKARAGAMKKHVNAHPIEGCDFGYKCPLVLEELGNSNGKTKMNCYKCNKEVYVVNSREQLKQYAELGRCVSFVKIEVDRRVHERGEVAYNHPGNLLL